MSEQYINRKYIDEKCGEFLVESLIPGTDGKASRTYRCVSTDNLGRIQERSSRWLNTKFPELATKKKKSTRTVTIETVKQVGGEFLGTIANPEEAAKVAQELSLHFYQLGAA